MNFHDLSKLTLRQINVLEEKITSAKKAARDKEREALRAQVDSMLEEAGLTLREVYPQFKNRRRSKKAH